MVYVSFSDKSFDDVIFPTVVQSFYTQGEPVENIFLHYPIDQQIPQIVASNTVYGQTRRAAALEERFYK